MVEIGLFPLGIVLLPGERIPLHIFEERYKELIGECLETGSPFGLILSDDDGMRAVGTRAIVTGVLDRFEDGRMNIAARGGTRFAVREPTQGRSFATALIEDFDDDADAHEPVKEEEARCLSAYRTLIEEVDAEADEPDLTAQSLAFELAGRIAFEAGPKQDLLEMRSERERILVLTEMLDQAAEVVRKRREIRERASGNGHVEPT